MASRTMVYKRRKRLKACKAGRDRKLRTAKLGSTPSRAVFFGDVPADKKGAE